MTAYRDSPFTKQLHDKDELIRGLIYRNNRLRDKRRQDTARIAQLEGLHKADTVEISKLDCMVKRRDAVIRIGTMKVASAVLFTLGFGQAFNYASSISSEPMPIEATSSVGGSSATHGDLGPYTASGYYDATFIEIDFEDDGPQMCTQPFIPPPAPRDPFRERASGRTSGDNVYIPWPVALTAKPIPTADVTSHAPFQFVAISLPAFPH